MLKNHAAFGTFIFVSWHFWEPLPPAVFLGQKQVRVKVLLACNSQVIHIGYGRTLNRPWANYALWL